MSGIYIHIPFCKQACHYCNFHFSTSTRQKEELVSALVQEIKLVALQQPALQKKTIDTLYLGGGTPSILSIDELQRILSTVQNQFTLSQTAEITLEANPDDINSTILQSWKQLGINRLSVGIQSFVAEELVWMNRAHTAGQSLQCIDDIQQAGFDNFSIDLMYGSPLLSDENWQKNVEMIVQKKIPHISCYALTVEPGTALDKMITLQKKTPVNAAVQADQFLLLMQWMEQYGYEHYEISNFSLPGCRSRHNSSYWSGQHYIGIGPSAHSFNGSSRRWNIANNALYIQSILKGTIPFEEEILTPVQQLNEYIMTSLRTMEGISTHYIAEKFEQNNVTGLLQKIKKWEEGGKIINSAGYLLLTKEGKLFADGIAADLFF